MLRDGSGEVGSNSRSCAVWIDHYQLVRQINAFKGPADLFRNLACQAIQ
jgi:hypothetical protein